MEVPEVSQSEIGQKQKLRVVLDMINKILQVPPHWSHAKWSVDSKYTKHSWTFCHLPEKRHIKIMY